MGICLGLVIDNLCHGQHGNVKHRQRLTKKQGVTGQQRAGKGCSQQNFSTSHYFSLWFKKLYIHILEILRKFASSDTKRTKQVVRSYSGNQRSSISIFLIV